MPEAQGDAGLQAERTVLAWRRTQVSLLVVACLAWRGGLHGVAGVAVLLALLGRSRERSVYHRGLAMLRGECTGLASRAVPLLWLMVAGLVVGVYWLG